MADPSDSASAETADQATATTTDQTDEAVQDPAAEIEKWKAHSRKMEAQSKANAEAAVRLKELEDASKSDLQRTTEQLSTLEQERNEAVAETARLRAAVKHGLPDELVDLLGTGTPDEIEARASKLAARLAATGQPRKPGPDPTQGTAADPNTSTAAQFAAAISGL